MSDFRVGDKVIIDPDHENHEWFSREMEGFVQPFTVTDASGECVAFVDTEGKRDYGWDEKRFKLAADDAVNHPGHYTDHPSGVECITITEHMNFCLGNAVKYIWRADLKNDAIEDLQKARWYIDREIERRTKNV